MASKILNQYPDVLTARMVAEIMSVGYTKALNIVKYSGLPYIKIGSTYRIYKVNFERWLASEQAQELIFNR